MKILVTGINGQVGHELARCLSDLKSSEAGAAVEVIALERSSFDLTNAAQMREVIRALRPHLIVNPAAYTAVDLAESEPALAMRINGEAPAIIAEEAQRLGAAMIHYSTDYVFDGSKEASYVETDPTCPINVYGHTKLAGERAVQASGVPHLILRTSWVYGTRGKNFLKTIERLAGDREELRIVADQHGAPTWSRTIAEGTARAIMQLCAPNGGSSALAIRPERWAEAGGIHHLTAQGATTWHGFASRIVAAGPRAGLVRVTPIATADYPVPAPRPHNSRMSCARFMQHFGALPEWDAALMACLQTERG